MIQKGVALLLLLATAAYAGSFNPAYTASVSVSTIPDVVSTDGMSSGRHASREPEKVKPIVAQAPGPHGHDHIHAPKPSKAKAPSHRGRRPEKNTVSLPHSSNPRIQSADAPAPITASAVVPNDLCPRGYKLAWNDEFDTYSVFNRYFTPQLYNGCQYGICGWGNNELEWYTNRSSNVQVSQGKLVLTARTTTDEEKVGCCDGGDCNPGECNYTSGRVRTYTKYSVVPKDTSGKKFIRVSARIQMPVGAGLWPSFSMLPEDSPENCSGCGAYGSWAASGAITVAQAVNDMKAMTGGINFGGPFPNSTSATFSAPLKSVPYNYHLFEIEWSLSKINWYVDGKKVFTVFSGKRGKVPNGWYTTGPGSGTNSPFDKPFYLIFNLAVGGTGVGSVTPDDIAAALAEPKQMKVDYVRVCTK